MQTGSLGGVDVSGTFPRAQLSLTLFNPASRFCILPDGVFFFSLLGREIQEGFPQLPDTESASCL